MVIVLSSRAAARNLAVFSLFGICLQAGAISAAQAPDPQLRTVLMQAINTAESFDHRFDAEVW
ncbi:MAG: hypothetical protein L0Y32_05415, partial [Nevskiales bacterium]|nr:hypothetical protein [Nevskiales bacterium]